MTAHPLVTQGQSVFPLSSHLWSLLEKTTRTKDLIFFFKRKKALIETS